MSDRIFWIGDSTVQENRIDTWPQCGIGQVLYLYLKPNVQVCNYAKNGRSTRSFLAEGRFSAVESALDSGDLLLIQFGHNDEKLEDPSRYTSPDEYAANLHHFAHAAQERGARPVLITPIVRRKFMAGNLQPTHGEYPQAVRTLAKTEGLPLIDLNYATRGMVQSAGQKKSRSFYMNLDAGCFPNYPNGKQDDSHLQYIGAVCFAALVARGLKDLGAPYADLLAEGIRADPIEMVCYKTNE